MSKESDSNQGNMAYSRDPIVEQSDAIGRMCDANNISKHAVPAHIDDVPKAIVAILRERARNNPSAEQGMGR